MSSRRRISAARASSSSHPLAGRAGLRLGGDARWLDAPDAGLPLDRLRAVAGGTGFRPALRQEGTDLRTLTGLAAAGHGLAVLPRWAATGVPGAVAIALRAPRAVHRTELDTAGDFGEPRRHRPGGCSSPRRRPRGDPVRGRVPRCAVAMVAMGSRPPLRRGRMLPVDPARTRTSGGYG
ncbi:LysR substrate-binding domain-containing protein [Streptomyces sp. NPDC001848]|uniref:LysR substrate-binding domain-containing protein n=1 Tax=Streptomyces sp. NPDC001848 TaxID=3364618 RepID=UPI0036905B37